MSRRTGAVLAVVMFLLVVWFGGSVYRFFQGSPPEGAEEKRIAIPEGTGFAGIRDILRKEGILDGTDWFSLVARIGGADRKVRAGIYRIRIGTPPGQVLRLLQRGSNEFVQVTIPEGLWLSEAAEIVAGKLRFGPGDFLRAARDPAVVAGLDLPGPSLEGYLFPETYRFFWDDSPERVIERMTDRFHQIFGEKEKARAAELGLSPREAITLASIIEAEAAVAEERPRISAVFHNRIRLGWMIQADPTVHFALQSRDRLLLDDLDVESPYNTYQVRGLPPGPICSPGALSIRAALHPVEGSREFYFVATGEGGRHHFSSSGAEHERARQRAKRRQVSP